jgi:sugar/nucleoside kinase (ribokinase family)
MNSLADNPGPDLLAGFDLARLDALLARFQHMRVAVIGDFFLDKYLEVDPRLAEPSLETGKTAHQVVGTRHSPGAAGTVANNLAALMALAPGGQRGSISAIGFTGDDGTGYELRSDLRSIGVGIEHLHTDTDPGRRTPAYLKPKDLDRAGLEGEHSRYDLKNRIPTGAAIERRIMDSIRQVIDTVDVLVAMDQVEDEGFGVFTPGLYHLLPRIVDGKGRPVCWADSRRRIVRFSGFVRKMNQFELLGIHDPEPGAVLPDETVATAFSALDKSSGSRIFVTAGEKGVWVVMDDETGAGSGQAGTDTGDRAVVFVPAVRVEGQVDPTGAGDSFTAGAVLALACGASSLEAALVGTLASSVTVRKLGTTGTATPEELREALQLWKGQRK